MKYISLEQEQQVEIVLGRLLSIEADHYRQDLENRLASALELIDVKETTALKRDQFAIAIRLLLDELAKFDVNPTVTR